MNTVKCLHLKEFKVLFSVIKNHRGLIIPVAEIIIEVWKILVTMPKCIHQKN